MAGAEPVKGAAAAGAAKGGRRGRERVGVLTPLIGEAAAIEPVSRCLNAARALSRSLACASPATTRPARRRRRLTAS